MESTSRLSMISEAPLLHSTANEPALSSTTKSQTSICAQSSPEQQPQRQTPKHKVWYRIKRAITRTKPTIKDTSEATPGHEPLTPTSKKESRRWSNSWSTGATTTKLFRRNRSDSASTTDANADSTGYVVTPASSLSSPRPRRRHRHHHHPEPQQQHDDRPGFGGLDPPGRALNEQAAAEREATKMRLNETGSSGPLLRASPFRHKRKEKRTPVWEVFELEESTGEERAGRALALVETCGAEGVRSGNPLAADRRCFDEGGEEGDAGEALGRPALGARF